MSKWMKYLPLIFSGMVGTSLADGYPQASLESLRQDITEGVQFSLDGFPRGMLVRLDWAGTYPMILHRTEEDLRNLREADLALFADYQDLWSEDSIDNSFFSYETVLRARLYKKGLAQAKLNGFRSVDDNYLVISGVSPLTGCSLLYKTGSEPAGAIFTDPCSSTYFDAAGRVLKGALGGLLEADLKRKAKYNLRVLPHTVTEDNIILLGELDPDELPEIKPNLQSSYAQSTGFRQLAIAAGFNDVDKVRTLLKLGINPNRRSGEQEPLYNAILGGSTELVHMLLEAGARPGGEYIKDTAEATGREDVLKLLEAYTL